MSNCSHGHGHCRCCLQPWCKLPGQDGGEIIKGPDPYHVTPVTPSIGHFALCEGCWAKLTPEQRVPFYRQSFWAYTQEDLDRDWPAIEAAVRAGL